MATSSSDCAAEIQPCREQKSPSSCLVFTCQNLYQSRELTTGAYNQDNATAIFNGFSFGFPLYYSGLRVPTDSKNLKSANMQSDIKFNISYIKSAYWSYYLYLNKCLFVVFWTFSGSVHHFCKQLARQVNVVFI